MNFKPFASKRLFFRKEPYNKEGEHWKEGEPHGSTYGEFVDVMICPNNYHEEYHRSKLRIVLGAKFLKDQDCIGWEELYLTPMAFVALQKVLKNVKIDTSTPIEIEV